MLSNMRNSKIKKVLATMMAIEVISTTSITTAFASDLSGAKNTEIASSSKVAMNLTDENKETLDNWLKNMMLTIIQEHYF